MEIKNRLFPYPVLSEDSDDYREGKFEVIPEVIENTDNDICLKFTIQLDDAKLRSLINEDKAEYAIHLECLNTCFRTVVKSQDTAIRYNLAKKYVNRKVQLLGMLVAKESINNFTSIALNRDYDDIDVSFKKGSILAYHNMAALDVNKNYEELSKNESIFRVCRYKKNETEHNPVRFELTDERIKITMDDDVYTIFATLKDRTHMDALIRTSVLLPALTNAFIELRSETSDYQGTAWYMQLDNHYRALGSSLSEKISSGESALILAQEFLNNPVNDLFINIKSMLDGEV